MNIILYIKLKNLVVVDTVESEENHEKSLLVE